jgi:SAM-dependent methyltransferase
MADRLSYATWHNDVAAETAMESGHRPFWDHFINRVPETDLEGRTVLDYGCNRGGFLRLLHALRPFRLGLGVDIATDSLAVAEAAKGDAPIRFAHTTELANWTERFDIAFSYEVIYLLPDLASHAAEMRRVLRPGAAYYAVTGCHTHCPLWPRWRTVLAEATNTMVVDRAPDDFAAAFMAADFAVSVRRFGYDGFVTVRTGNRYHPRLIDALTYAADDKLLFRFERPG